MLVNSVPLIELILRTDTAQAHLWTASAEGGGGPEALASGTDGHALALNIDSSAGAGERALDVGIDVVAVSTPPFYEDGALEECANGHSMHQETQVQATPTAECDTRSRSVSNGDKRRISGSAFPKHVNATSSALMEGENEGHNIFIDKARTSLY